LYDATFLKEYISLKSFWKYIP